MATEKRLIDANDILLGIETFKKCYREHEPLIPLVKASIGALTMVAEFVNRTPTVDAVEVVHGRFEAIRYGYGCLQISTCSVCGEKQGLYINGRLPSWNYCPNCGAKMDGGENNG